VKKPIVKNLEEELADTNQEFYPVKWDEKDIFRGLFDVFRAIFVEVFI
jgi:hypothetical protein